MQAIILTVTWIVNPYCEKHRTRGWSERGKNSSLILSVKARMIVAFAFLFPVLGASLWAYFRFRPAGIESSKLHTFDVFVVASAVALCVAVAFYLRSNMAGGPDSAWWPVVAAIYSLVIFPVCLAAGGAFRHVIFSRSRAGTG